MRASGSAPKKGRSLRVDGPEGRSAGWSVDGVSADSGDACTRCSSCWRGVYTVTGSEDTSCSARSGSSTADMVA